MAPKLTGFMFATFPILIILAMIFGKYIRRLTKQTQNQLAASSVIVDETLQAIRAVKAFTSELFEINRYQSSINEVVSTALKAARYRALFVSFIVFVLFGGIVTVLWYGAYLVQQGAITIGDLISFILYTTLIGGSIAGLGDLYGQIQRAMGASERVLDILSEEAELTPSSQQSSLNLNKTIQGTISINNVSFAYPTRLDVTVLKNISLEIKAGEKIALVGPSGAGKSTLAQLLLRYYPIQEGNILIDDRLIQDFPLTELRLQIGLVPQEVILFGGTIRENIGYGQNNPSLEAIKDAADQANALKFIEEFPEGFDTLVGERGIQLSGGQRQRIAIARAILKNPSILVLDEATSSLDAESEFLVQQALERLMQNRTTIVIAHRLATIRKVDRIYVVKHGQIVESGSHAELYEAAQDYRNLVDLQMLSV